MTPIVRPLSVLFFIAISYLIVAEMVSPWLHLPWLGNVGFVLFFVLFSVTHCLAEEGWQRTASFFTVSASITYLMEEIGVRTGLVFGEYHYSDQLGMKLGHVPVLIPLEWFMMIYPSRAIAKRLLRNFDLGSVPGILMLSGLSAIVMTAWDLVMDPGMSTVEQTWVWEQGGAYFGVPLQNFLGWIVTTFLVYCAAGFLGRNDRERVNGTSGFAILPLMIYALFALRYVATNLFPALQVVAAFCMGIPALLALLPTGNRTAASSGEEVPTAVNLSGKVARS